MLKSATAHNLTYDSVTAVPSALNIRKFIISFNVKSVIGYPKRNPHAFNFANNTMHYQFYIVNLSVEL